MTESTPESMPGGPQFSSLFSAKAEMRRYGGSTARNTVKQVKAREGGRVPICELAI